MIVHVAETEGNREYAVKTYGAPSFVYLEKLGVLGENFVADHAVWVDDEEMEIMADRGVSVITNPESNMKLASGTAPVHRYLDRGVTVGLGTDGAASNNNLDMMGEMATLAKLHKVYDSDPTHLGARTVLGLATIGGARALGLEKQVGSLTVGKRADIAVLDFDKPHLTPMYDPFSHIVYAALASDVRDVVVGGVPRVRGRRLVNTDMDKIMANARQLAERVRASLKQPG
jgi:5-methylthioadenosine/S-adenosylhomocysteine deaminase